MMFPVYFIKMCNPPLFGRNGLGGRDVDKKGVIADTPLYHLPAFDLVWDVTADEFHCCKEGNVKAMLVSLFLHCQDKQSRDTALDFSYWYNRMRLPSEAARSTRPLKLLQFKGSEFGNIMLFSMVVLAELLPDPLHP